LSGTGRILLKRGEGHKITGTIDINGAYTSFRMGAWGSGTKPIIYGTYSGNLFKTLDLPASATVVLDNLDIRSSWNERNLTGSGQGAGNTVGLFVDDDAHTVVSECDFVGLGNGSIHLYGGAGRIFVNDTVNISWGATCPIYAHKNADVLESGATMVTMGNAEGSGFAYPCNVLFQNNYMLGSAGTLEFIGIGYGGITIRNNIMVMPGVDPRPSITGGNFKRFVGLSKEGTDPENIASPISVYNNTFVNLQTDAENSNTLEFVRSGSTFSDIREFNNIKYVPNKTGGNQYIAEMPLTTAVLLPTARYLGLIYTGAPTLDTAYATPNGEALDYAPDSGSAALNSTTGVEISHRDFFGAVRGGHPDRGAIQTT
jgi:hypothetical protein